MSIDISIVTTTPQIVDTNNENGFGTVTVTPSQAFTYYDGATTISVTTNSQTISVSNGQLDSALTLAPSTGASNNPVVYYIVDIRVNGTYQRLLWAVPETPTSVEFSAVQRLSSGASLDASVAALLTATDPFKQYVLRSDTLDAPVAGAMSDGRGAIPRGDVDNGNKLDPSWLGGTSPSGGLTAADVPVVDAGGYFTGTDVEAVEQEIGATLAGLPTFADVLKSFDYGSIKYAAAASGAIYPSPETIATITLTQTGLYVVFAYASVNVQAAATINVSISLGGLGSNSAVWLLTGMSGYGGTDYWFNSLSIQQVINVTSIASPNITLIAAEGGGTVGEIAYGSLIAIRIGD